MMARMKQIARNSKGFVLVAFTLGIFVTIGCAGLAIDIGRMYIARTEAQTFCDAAAVAAAAKLDGTSTGIANAISAVTGPCSTTPDALICTQRYDFQTTAYPAGSITIRFAQDPPGSTWSSNPNPATGYVIAEVSVKSLRVPMMLMPVLTNNFSATISATATAKQIPQYGSMDHLWPFSPTFLPPGGTTQVAGSNMPTPPDPFGMIPAQLKVGDTTTYQQGGIYDLRNPSSFNYKVSSGSPISNDPDLCVNERTTVALNFQNENNQAYRNYLWNTQGGGADAIKDQITGSTIPTGLSVNIGQIVDSNAGCTVSGVCLQPGDMNSVPDAINQLVNGSKNGKGASGDTDSSSPNYATYYQAGNGNGSRVVTVAINSGRCTPSKTCGGTCYDPCPNYPQAPYAPEGLAGTEAPPGAILGFAGFFLLAQDYSKVTGEQPVCAEYIGPVVPNQAGAGGGPGMYLVKLVQ